MRDGEKKDDDEIRDFAMITMSVKKENFMASYPACRHLQQRRIQKLRKEEKGEGRTLRIIVGYVGLAPDAEENVKLIVIVKLK